MRALISATAVAAFVLLASRAEGQRVSGGVDYAFAEYSEQGTSLRFGGAGVGGHAAVEWRRLGLHFAVASLGFDSEVDGGVAEPFDLVQMDLRVRARLTRLVSVEAGYLHRDMKPLHAAQSVGAMRLGAIAAFPLAPGSEVAVRTAYLGGSRFSGGGSAPFAVEVGLGASYAPWSSRVRITGDLEFQRFDRRTSTAAGRLATPIQSSTARIGIEFGRE